MRLRTISNAVRPPAISIRLSKMDAGSARAQSSDDIRPAAHKPRSRVKRDQKPIVADARRSAKCETRGRPRNPRIAYSVKCASFRVITWTTASVSGVVLGNNQRTSGPMMREVFPAEKLSRGSKGDECQPDQQRKIASEKPDRTALHGSF